MGEEMKDQCVNELLGMPEFKRRRLSIDQEVMPLFRPGLHDLSLGSNGWVTKKDLDAFVLRHPVTEYCTAMHYIIRNDSWHVMGCERINPYRADTTY